MNKIRHFLKAHAFGCLVLAVVLTFPFALASAKYTKAVVVTDNLSVEIVKDETYTIDRDTFRYCLKNLSSAYSITSISFVKATQVPSDAVEVYEKGVQEDGSGKVGVFKSGSSLYIAPAEGHSPANNNKVIYAPKSCEYLMNAYRSETSWWRELTSIDFSNLNTSKVETMHGMFANLSTVTSLNIKSFDMSKVVYSGYMFYGCSAIQNLDISNFNTSDKLLRTDYMFYGCKSLESLVWPVSADTSKVGLSRSMFAYCESLKTLDLTHYSTKSSYAYSCYETMFDGCTALERATFGSKFLFYPDGKTGLLPAPDSSKIEGATGLWYDSVTGLGYTPAQLVKYHNNLGKTRTYVAVL